MKGPHIIVHQVKCGDAITIKFKNKDKHHAILIDGGYIDTYKTSFKPFIGKLAEGKRKADLWILTHLDADHINGAVSYLRDPEFKNKKLIRKFWFNCLNKFRIPESTTKKSVGKGIEIRDILEPLKTVLQKEILQGMVQAVGNANIQVLWPDKSTYKELGEHWKTEEKRFWELELKKKKKVDVKDCDYHLPIEKLAARKIPNIKKQDITNRSSIAFIFELSGKRVLFLGDSYPDDIILKLKDITKDGKERMKIEYVKLSHHASKNNFDPDILNYIDCKKFIVSADALNKHKLPNKETLAKILNNKRRDVKKEQIEFYFNYDDTVFRNLFNVDKDAEIRFNFNCIYPKKGDTAIKLPL